MSLAGLCSQSTVTVERQVSARDAAGGISNAWSTHYASVPCRIEDASAATVEQWNQRQINVTHEMFTQQSGIGSGMRIREPFSGAATVLAQGAQTATVTTAAVDMLNAPLVNTAMQNVTAISGTTPTLDGAFQERGYNGAFTGDTVSGSLVVSNVSVNGLAVGDAVSGSGIPALTTIAAVGVNSITLSAVATLTAATVALTATASWTALAGSTFAQIGLMSVPIKQTIVFQRTKRYVRYVGTIAGTNPSFNVGVDIQPVRYYLVQSIIENRATGRIPYFCEVLMEEQRGRV